MESTFYCLFLAGGCRRHHLLWGSLNRGSCGTLSEQSLKFLIIEAEGETFIKITALEDSKCDSERMGGAGYVWELGGKN